MIKLNHTSVHKIRLHALRAYPEECCGVLMGRETETYRQVCDVLELKNVHGDERRRRFVIAPEDYRTAEEEARRGGLEILGLYHSHPDHPARPSQFDVEHALPYWSSIIVSVNDGQPGELTSWLLKEDRSSFEEESVEVLDGDFVHPCK